MFTDFLRDLQKAQTGENIVCDVLSKLLGEDDYTINNVALDEQFYYKGDIAVTDSWGDTVYIDVKDDSCICNTGNILAEHRVWIRGKGWVDGFMQKAQYDYVAYLSQPDKKIYILDFALWKKYYKTVFVRHLFIDHNGEQTTDGFLMRLDSARDLGIVVMEIGYDEEYMAVEVLRGDECDAHPFF